MTRATEYLQKAPVALSCSLAEAQLGPIKAAAQLANQLSSEHQRTAWLESARISAIVGSAPSKSSIASARSALKAWGAFADAALGARGRHLPPSVSGLIAWSHLFRFQKTFTKYIAFVRLGCDISNVPNDATFDPLLERAKQAVKKREPAPRPKMAIRVGLVSKLVDLARREGDETSAMLYAISYIFLLRVPSEALPLVWDSGGAHQCQLPQGQHSACFVRGQELTLRLARRKNKPHGTVLARRCVCHDDRKSLCPLHVIAPWLLSLGPHCQPFVRISPAKARSELRRRLAALGVESPELHCLHDFRRGQAQDLIDSGASLAQILRAGEWSSPAFLVYLDLNKLDRDAATAAVIVEESDNEE